MDIIGRDASSIISDHIEYKDLYNTICVNKFWHQLSIDQLESRHQDHIVLPIIHNRRSKAEFIGILNTAFTNYMSVFKIHEKSMMSYINSSPTYYESSDLLPINDHINKLYSYIIKKLYFGNKSTQQKLSHTLNPPLSAYHPPLFEKAFTCYVYLQNLLNDIYLGINIIRENTYHDCYIYWNTDAQPERIFNIH